MIADVEVELFFELELARGEQRVALIGRVEGSEGEAEFADRRPQIPGGPGRALRGDLAVVVRDVAAAHQREEARVSQPLGERARVEPAPVPVLDLAFADDADDE